MKKIILFANWGLGQLVMQKIVKQSKMKIIAVVTQYDIDKNDDKFFNIVFEYAKQKRIKIYHRWQDIDNNIFNVVDFGISISFNQIFNNEILNKINIVNFHPSFLPKYRGPSPIMWQLKNNVEKIGGTIHKIDNGIDTGEILCQEYFNYNKEDYYFDFIDKLNEHFSEWITSNILNIDFNLVNKNKHQKSKYYNRLGIYKPLSNKTISEITNVINRKKITIFSGNRAEFGILFQLIKELSEKYFIELILSGGHTQKPWETKDEVYRLIEQNSLNLNVIEINNNNIRNHYRDAMILNYKWGFDYFIKNKKAISSELSIVLGDRVESYAFANASFFNNIPVCHIFGGDISNVPYFDTNIRHAITKISSLHLVSNKSSQNNVIRMGEERWRVELIGNISLDNYKNNNYASKNELVKKYGLQDTVTLLLTYHPSQYISKEKNFKHFKSIYDTCEKLNVQTVITYPNNDDGHELITQFLEKQPTKNNNIFIQKSLGVRNYLGLLKEFNCIMLGNSSSGLYETAYTGTPAINIGDRQINRPRGINVLDISFENIKYLESEILNIINNYSKIKKKNLKELDFFGDGNSVNKAIDKINEFINLPMHTRINKKFIDG